MSADSCPLRILYGGCSQPLALALAKDNAESTGCRARTPNIELPKLGAARTARRDRMEVCDNAIIC